MKQKIFTLLLLATIGLVSCRKNNNDPNITQYDDIQIQNYIKANGLTGMKRDTSHGDTSGIYYEILSQGSTTGAPLDYPDSVNFVLSVRSFDGKYVNSDTLNLAHYAGLLGHISLGGNIIGFTKGLQNAIHDLVKYKGTRARILVPSRSAYGVNGAGSGSSSNVNTRIAGNQCIDYYVNVVSNLNAYDDYVINDYAKRNNIAIGTYTKIPAGQRGAGLYYKVNTPGTGSDVLSDVSSFTATYAGRWLNGATFDSSEIQNKNAGIADLTTPSSFSISSVIPGVQEALKGQTQSAAVSILIPSRLAYAKSGTTGTGPNVCMNFDFTISTVTNP